MLGEDYLGLRELGIAAEFGMSSLSIPKRLLKGKKGKGVVAAYVLFCFLVFCVSSTLPPSSFSESSFRPFHLHHLLYPFCALFIPPSLQPTFHLRETSADRLRLACPFFTFDFSWPFSSCLFSALPAHRLINFPPYHSAKPTEPPPPYPPPPPFVLLTSSKVDDQIGLLRSYYQSRFDKLAADAVGPAPPPPFIAPRLSGPMIPGLAGPSLPALAGPNVPAPALVGQSLPGPTALPGLSMPPLPPLAAPPINSFPAVPPLPLPTMTNDQQVDVKPPLATQSQSQVQLSQATLPTHTETLSQATAPPQSTAPSSQDIVMAAPARPAIELVLPDDAPNLSQMKMGPLGQIVKVSGGAGGSKKRVRGPQVSAAASASAAGDGGEGGGAKKTVKKGNVGVGTGNGRKKNFKPGEQGQPQPQPLLPAGVVASA